MQKIAGYILMEAIFAMLFVAIIFLANEEALRNVLKIRTETNNIVAKLGKIEDLKLALLNPPLIDGKLNCNEITNQNFKFVSCKIDANQFIIPLLANE